MNNLEVYMPGTDISLNDCMYKVNKVIINSPDNIAYEVIGWTNEGKREVLTIQSFEIQTKYSSKKKIVGFTTKVTANND